MYQRILVPLEREGGQEAHLWHAIRLASALNAESLGIQKTHLLADFWPHGGVAQAYGIFREKNGFSERAVFIVDVEGVVRFKKIYPMREPPDIGEILKALEEI